MFTTKRASAAIGLLLVSLLAADAFAQHVTYGKRNIVTGKNTLEIIAGPVGNYSSYSLFGGQAGFQIRDTEGDSIIDLVAGAAYGVHNDLSIGAIVLPIRLSPDGDYLNPTVFGRYRFLTGNFEAAGELGFVLPVQDGTDFTLRAGVPLRHRSDSLRVDIKPFLVTDFDNFNIEVPVEIMFNVNPAIFVGAITGFNRFENDFTDFISIPVGVGAGYTLPGVSGPLADITASFVFPGLVFDDVDNNDTFQTDAWTLSLGATVYLSL